MALDEQMSRKEYKWLKTKARKMLLKAEKEWATKVLTRHQVEELMIRFLLSRSDPDDSEQLENKSTISV
jgi:hypothetical protein